MGEHTDQLNASLARESIQNRLLYVLCVVLSVVGFLFFGDTIGPVTLFFAIAFVEIASRMGNRMRRDAAERADAHSDKWKSN
jgi:hypothetical protein